MITFESEAPSCSTDDGSLRAIVKGGSGNYSYLWNTGSTDSNLVSIPAAAYTVAITDNDLGCTFSENFNLSNLNGPFFTAFVVNAGLDKNDGEIYLSVNETDSVTVTWADGSSNFVRQGLAPGDYTARVVNENECAGASIKTFTVLNGKGNLSITATVTPTDFDEATGAIDLEVSDASKTFSYNWSNGSTNQDIVNLEAGLYSVIVTDILSGDQVDSTFSVNSQNGPIITLEAITEETCSGNRNASITINTGIQPATILWSNGETSTSITGLLTSSTIADLAPGVYSVEATDIVTGSSSFAEYTVIRRNPIQLSISSTEITCDPDTMDGTAMVVAIGGRMPYAYLWNNGETTQTIENLSAGKYTLIFTDANNCSVQDSIVVELSSQCDGIVDPTDPTNPNSPIATRDEVPNVFTPNGDGTNDTWKVASNPDSYDELSVKIYNRLGARVFEDGAYENSWRGTFQSTGENLPEGTYFYEIVAERNDERNVIKGFVVIKR